MMKWTSSNSSLNSPNDRKSVFYTNTEVTGIIKVNRKITISIRLTLKNEKYVAWKWDIKLLCHFRAWRNRSRNRLRKWINIIKYIELINWIKYVSFSRRHEQYCIHFPLISLWYIWTNTSWWLKIFDIKLKLFSTLNIQACCFCCFKSMLFVFPIQFFFVASIVRAFCFLCFHTQNIVKFDHE